MVNQNWISVAAWGKSHGVSRQAAHRMLPRVAGGAKRRVFPRWQVLAGTAYPPKNKAGRKKGQKSSRVVISKKTKKQA